MAKTDNDCLQEPGRTYNIDNGSTYIEKQEITFEHVDKIIIAADGKCADGTNLFDRLQKVLGQVPEQSPNDAPAKNDAPNEYSCVSRLEKKLNPKHVDFLEYISAGLRYVKQQNVVINDYEWAGIKFRIDTYSVFSKLSDKSFVGLLVSSGTFTEEDCPKADNLKTLIVSGDYPDWRIISKKCENYAQIMKVVKTFDEGCSKYLNEHRK